MTCKHAHTKFQPTDAHWVCPECGSGHDKFYIDESPNGDCEKLHVEDYIQCHHCHSSWTGDDLAKIMCKKNTMVKCPCCNGTGYVKKGKK